MSLCEMCVEFDMKTLLKSIAETIELKFLTPESKPTSIGAAMQCAHHVMKSILRQLEELIDDKQFLALFARCLNLQEHIDEEKELEILFHDMKVPHQLRDVLKEFFMSLSKKDKDKNQKSCANR